MTDQEIIGDMEQFYIAKAESFIATDFIEEESLLPQILRDQSASCEISFYGDEQKILSIRSFRIDPKDEDRGFNYLAGFIGEPTEKTLSDIELGHLQPITKDAYLLKYRELEADDE